MSNSKTNKRSISIQLPVVARGDTYGSPEQKSNSCEFLNHSVIDIVGLGFLAIKELVMSFFAPKKRLKYVVKNVHNISLSLFEIKHWLSVASKRFASGYHSVANLSYQLAYNQFYSLLSCRS